VLFITSRTARHPLLLIQALILSCLRARCASSAASGSGWVLCISLSLLDCVRAPGSGRCAAAVHHLSQVLVLSCNWIGSGYTACDRETTGRAHGELGSRSIHVQLAIENAALVVVLVSHCHQTTSCRRCRTRSI
jgi:hypothetical protein